MKTYKIPVYYKVESVVTVKAENLRDAYNKAAEKKRGEKKGWNISKHEIPSWNNNVLTAYETAWCHTRTFDETD